MRNSIKAIKGVADDNNLGMMIGNTLWHTQYPVEAKTDPEGAIRHLMQIIFANKQTVSGRIYDYIGGKKPVRIILNHELIGTSGSGRLVWTQADPYYQGFKEAVLSRSLIIAMEEAKVAGLKWGEEVVFYYGGDQATLYEDAAPNHVNNVIGEVRKAKEAAAKEFNLPIDAVPYGIAVQAHVYKEGVTRPSGHYKMPTKEQMGKTFSRYKSELDHFYLIEVGAIQASLADTAGFLDDVVSAAYQNKAEGVQLWLGVRNPNQPSQGWFDPSLSFWIPGEKSSVLAPSQMYYALTRALFDRLQSSQN
jgi:hypothetical protein